MIYCEKCPRVRGSGVLEVGLAPVRKAKKQKREKQGHKKLQVTAKHMACCVCAHVYVHAYLQRPKDSFRCRPQEHSPFSLKQGLLLAWAHNGLDWVDRKIQGSACLYPPRELQEPYHTFLKWILGAKLRSSSNLQTELFPQFSGIFLSPKIQHKKYGSAREEWHIARKP